MVCPECFKISNFEEKTRTVNNILERKKIEDEIKLLTPLIEKLRETIQETVTKSYAKVVENKKQKNMNENTIFSSVNLVNNVNLQTD